MAVLILAQHDNASLDAATLHAVSAAAELPGPCHMLVAGKDCGAVAEAAARDLIVRPRPGLRIGRARP